MGYRDLSFRITEPPTRPCYVTLRRSPDFHAWNGTGFETYDPSHFPAYAIPLVSMGGTQFSVTIPDGVPAGGSYSLDFYIREGSVPDSTADRVFGGGASLRRFGKGTADYPTAQLINHNTGGADALRVTDGEGNGIDGAVIRAYLTSEYDGNPLTAPVRGQATTVADGRWERPIYRDAGLSYTVTVHAAAGYLIASRVIEPE